MKPARALCCLLPLLLAALAAAAPRLVLERTEVDLGEILQGEPAAVEFPFRNQGAGTLVLQEPRAWCGCEASLEGGSSYQPGDGGTVRVTFDPGARVGRFRRSVVLLTNDPEQPEASLVLLGEVREALAVEPDLLFLPELPRGGRASGEIRLLAREAGPFEVLGWESSHPALAVRVEPLEEPEQGILLHIDVQGDLPPGEMREHVIVRTSCPQRPTLRIPILGRVAERITLEPAWCSFRVTSPGDRGSRTVTLHGSGEEPLSILSVEAPAPFLAARALPSAEGKPREAAPRVAIDLVDEAPPGSTRALILVRTDDPEQPELTIPVVIHRRAAA